MRTAIVWYIHKLSEVFMYRPLTPAAIAQAQSMLADLQTRASMDIYDNNPAWQVKVKIRVDYSQSPGGTLVVEPENEDSILLIDFDS